MGLLQATVKAFWASGKLLRVHNLYQVWNMANQGMGLFHYKHSHTPSLQFDISAVSQSFRSQVRHVVCVELGTQASVGFLPAFLRSFPFPTQVNMKWSNTTNLAWIKKFKCTKKECACWGRGSRHGNSVVLHLQLTRVPAGCPGHWWAHHGTKQPSPGGHFSH